MPTRPVTWNLDVPPDNQPAEAPRAEEPKLAELRKSVLGTRFEWLKISVFTLILLALTGLAIHRSHLADGDSQFGADIRAASVTVKVAVANEYAALRQWTTARATGTMTAIDAAVPALGHESVFKFAPHAEHLEPRSDIRTHAFKHPQPVASKPAPPLKDRMESLQSNIDPKVTASTPRSLKDMVTPDALIAGIVGLVFYVVFVVILLRRKGGLRAFSRRAPA